MILVSLIVIALSQVAGLVLIARALGPDKTAVQVRESAMLEPTIDSDYGGLV